jgi:hypothetical protein
VTGWLPHDEFDPVRVSVTLFSMSLPSPARANFGIGSVAGVVVGSFVAALLSRGFRWEACDDARELKRHMIGALLMGTGGIMSMGCTIGQGLCLSTCPPICLAPLSTLRPTSHPPFLNFPLRVARKTDT